MGAGTYHRGQPFLWGGLGWGFLSRCPLFLAQPLVILYGIGMRYDVSRYAVTPYVIRYSARLPVGGLFTIGGGVRYRAGCNVLGCRHIDVEPATTCRHPYTDSVVALTLPVDCLRLRHRAAWSLNLPRPHLLCGIRWQIASPFSAGVVGLTTFAKSQMSVGEFSIFAGREPSRAHPTAVESPLSGGSS